MKRIDNKNLTSFSDHLDQQYGKKGTVKRDAYEKGFEAFWLKEVITEIRKEQSSKQKALG